MVPPALPAILAGETYAKNDTHAKYTVYLDKNLLQMSET